MKLKVRNPSSTEIEEINYGMWQKNGNVLEFDSANSDYLEINDSFTWGNTSDISLEIKTIPKWQSGSSILLMIGNINSPNSGYLRIRINDGSSLLFQYADVNGSNSQEITVPYANNDEINIKIEGGDLFINGVLDSSLVAQSINIDTDFGKPTFSKYTNLNQWYLSQQLQSAIVNGTTFLLREGSGNTTTSEDGTTTATINTSHASGADILWQESKQKWLNYKI
jgi:hypothetical protein